MRVSENRYVQDLRRLNLAQQLIEHGVRTQWICAITGLTPNRVRNLVRSYRKPSARLRSRGLAPTNCQVFFQPSWRRDVGALAGLAMLFELVPETPVRSARQALPGVEWGEQLCRVFDLFGLLVGEPVASMDQFLLLVISLAEGRLRVGFCAECQATIVLDPLARRAPLCEACRHPRAAPSKGLGVAPETMPAKEVGGPFEAALPDQQTLF